MTRWLGQLPSGWSEARLDRVARAWPSNVDKHSVDGQQSVQLCNYTDVYKNEAITRGLDFMRATATAEQVSRFRIATGDTLITKDSETADDIGIPAFVEHAAPDLVCGYHLAIVRPDPSLVAPRFLFWVMASEPTLKQWAVLASGVTRVGIRSRDLAKAAIPLPPIAEQHAIAAYLDHETARIDTLIGKQEQLIATLRERRSAVVARALATGPLVRLRRLVEPARPLTYGILQAGEPVSAGVPYIGPSDMPGEGRSPRLEELRRTTPEISAAYKRSLLRGGDIVVSIGPAYGKVALIADELLGANLTQDTVRVAPRLDLVIPRYLVWVLTSRPARNFWDAEIMGATFKRLNLGQLARTPIPVPPLDEQREIVAHLDSQTAKIDALIANAERFIELSKERRTALIAAAVTGQVDVRTMA